MTSPQVLAPRLSVRRRSAFSPTSRRPNRDKLPISMHLRIIARSNKAIAVGVNLDGQYAVIGFDPWDKLELGDELRGSFDPAGGFFQLFHNVTQSTDMPIILVQASLCSKAVALQRLGFDCYASERESCG